MEASLIKNIIGWDTVNWGKALHEWDKTIKTNRQLTCLELGARTGGLSLYAAMNGHKVICTDLENPETTAKPIHLSYAGVSDKITYQAIDVLNIPYTYDNYFDVVFLKSVLPSVGHGNRKDLQQLAVNQIYKALKPGGKLLFAENLTASSLHNFARKNFVKWGGDVRYLKKTEMLEFLEPFSSVEYKLVGFLGTFGRTENQRIFFGKIDSLFDFLIPNSWRYLIIGTATK